MGFVEGELFTWVAAGPALQVEVDASFEEAGSVSVDVKVVIGLLFHYTACIG